MCPCRGARASSQVSQTAARGRNRPAEFIGESLPHRYHPSGHIRGFFLRPSASHTEPIVEGGAHRQRPTAEAGAPAPGLNAARMFRCEALAVESGRPDLTCLAAG
jgi:hypothetical protein